ncbi:hypothetical protein GJ496_012029 [Pomphorhynchus laevis]|nr:hypothetical protein GJ496_012029 [Pomphorhynchus laevis]
MKVARKNEVSSQKCIESLNIELEAVLQRAYSENRITTKALQEATDLLQTDIITNCQGLWIKLLCPISGSAKSLCFMLLKTDCQDFRYLSICKNDLSYITWSSLRTFRQCGVMLYPCVHYPSYMNDETTSSRFPFLTCTPTMNKMKRMEPLGGFSLLANLSKLKCVGFLENRRILANNDIQFHTGKCKSILRSVYLQCAYMLDQDSRSDSRWPQRMQKLYPTSSTFIKCNNLEIPKLPFSTVFINSTHRHHYIAHILDKCFRDEIDRNCFRFLISLKDD